MNNPAEGNFEFLCKISDLRQNSGKRFIVGVTEIALFKVDGKIFSLSNICPHQQTALIYNGFIEDGCVVCPAHGWKFDLQTGKKSNGRKGLDSYEVKIQNDDVLVKVIPKELNW